MSFHESQLKAIRHVDGPMMVLAGPGSGKTTVVTHRVKYLVEECRVEPGSILVITFTKAAAREMKERFDRLTEHKYSAVSFGTFHAVFFTILKYAYRYGADNIIRDEERLQIIREQMELCRLDVEDTAEFAAGVLQEISAVKGDMLSMDYYYAKSCPEEIFRKLYRGYEDALRRRNKLDFDDMLVMCHELFRQRKDILSAWQKKYRYILVDEFQDINRVQYEIVRMLAAPENNLFIVGDDDQSIYRFRGARPEIMLGFEKDYPQTQKTLLGINYRSTDPIVAAAGRLIAGNRARFGKQLKSARGPGRPVTTAVWEDAQSETRGIVEEILDYQKMGYRLADIAVLYRTNMEPRLLAERLMEFNVPFRMKDTLPDIYEHWIAQDILAYIRAAARTAETAGRAARADVLRIINRPKRYVNREALEGKEVSWDALEAWYQDRNWMVERIERLKYDLHMLSGLAPNAAVNYIRKGIGYDDFLKEYAEYRRMKPEELLEIADQLQESASGYCSMDEWYRHMAEYKKQLEEQSRSRERGSGTDSVSLMTMHSAKGLEFPIVYILDANEKITPYRKAVLPEDIEEERRMFYVAMTRAKDRLHVCYVKSRYGKPQERSRFIDEYMGKEAAVNQAQVPGVRKNDVRQGVTGR